MNPKDALNAGAQENNKEMRIATTIADGKRRRERKALFFDMLNWLNIEKL